MPPEREERDPYPYVISNDRLVCRDGAEPMTILPDIEGLTLSQLLAASAQHSLQHHQRSNH